MRSRWQRPRPISRLITNALCDWMELFLLDEIPIPLSSLVLAFLRRVHIDIVWNWWKCLIDIYIIYIIVWRCSYCNETPIPVGILATRSVTVSVCHCQQLLRNIFSQLSNGHCCVKHCWGVYELNIIVNSVLVCDWTDKLAIIGSKGEHTVSFPW